MNTSNIIWIIVGTGIFGGVINYYRSLYDKKFEFSQVIRPVLIGLAAAALVPLFLNMISSDLLKAKDDVTTNYFVFLGFCLIASIFSGEFIDSIGKKVLNQIGEVKKEIEETNTEDDSPEINELNQDNDLTENQNLVLKAFIENKYTYRSISGLASQTGLDKTVIKKELVDLGKLGLTEVVERQKGPRWKITSEGYKK